MRISIVFLSLLLLACLSTVLAQEVPKVEVFGGYSNMNAFSSNPHGWNASIAGNFSPWLGLVADVGGQYRETNLENIFFGTQNQNPTLIFGESGNRLHSALAGPRVSWRTERFTPFAHALLGIANGHFDRIGNRRSESGKTSFGMAFGGGLDIKLSDQIAVRAFQVDYFRDRSGVSDPNKVRVGVGIVFRFGGR